MNIYREEILEHWQNPQNWGTLADFDLEAEVVNPLCGDRIKVQIKLSRSFHLRGENMVNVGSHLGGGMAVIEDIAFSGTGCAISIACASILSENIKNRSLRSLKSLKGEDILKMIGSNTDGFPPARLKCAFLALEALRKINSKHQAPNFK